MTLSVALRRERLMQGRDDGAAARNVVQMMALRREMPFLEKNLDCSLHMPRSEQKLYIANMYYSKQYNN